MPTTLLDEQLEAYGERVHGATVVITGAGAGLGKAAALKFASYGANVVVGDFNADTAAATVAEIEQAGGNAIAEKCDIRSFDEQTSMFEAAVAKYGAVDIVIANAGIQEMTQYFVPQVTDGKVGKPDLATLEVNLLGASLTVYLALRYLKERKLEGPPKSLVVMGSLAAYGTLPGAILYQSSKLGLAGLVHSLHKPLAEKGIRTSVIFPFFAPTALNSEQLMRLIGDLPMVPVIRIASTIISAATDADLRTSGASYILLDDGPTQMFTQEDVYSPPFYKELAERCNAPKPDWALSSVGATSLHYEPEETDKHLGRVKDSVAVIVGGAGKMSAHIARIFAQHGARIVLIGISIAAMEMVVAEVTDAGGHAIAIQADVRSFDDLQTAFQTTIAKFGSVDVVVFNAEVETNDQFVYPMVDDQAGKPDLAILEANVVGSLYASHLALYYLNVGRTPDSSRVKAIIQMSSASTHDAISGSPLYIAGKMAIVGITRGLHHLLLKRGIKTAGVSPELAEGVTHADVATAVLLAAVQPDHVTFGAGYVAGAKGEITVLTAETIRAGAFKQFNNRLAKVYGLDSMHI